MQLPPVHPPMPAALSPVSFGVYGCMGHLACFLVFLVPHSTFCLQNGALEGYSSSPTLPRLEHFYQMASQAADLLRQALGQSLKTNTVQLRRTSASRKDLVGWGQSRGEGFLTLNLDILRLTTRGLQRSVLGASGLAATSSRSCRYNRGWSALAVRCASGTISRMRRNAVVKLSRLGGRWAFRAASTITALTA